MEWCLDLCVFIWLMVENPWHPKESKRNGRIRLSGRTIETTPAEYSYANKCLLALKHGTLNFVQAR
jgi:hypothetical protein